MMDNKFDFYCEEALSGSTPIDIVFESDIVLAYYHTKPFWQTHIVIVPKKHIKDLAHVVDEDMYILEEMMRVARDLAKDFDLKDGIQLLTNLGKWQDTPHLHFHFAVGEKIG